MLDFEDTPRKNIKSKSDEQTRSSEFQTQEQTRETQNSDTTRQNQETSTGLPSTDLPEAKPTEPMACSIDDPTCDACQ